MKCSTKCAGSWAGPMACRLCENQNGGGKNDAMTDNVIPVSEIHASGGLEKWASKFSRSQKTHENAPESKKKVNVPGDKRSSKNSQHGKRVGQVRISEHEEQVSLIEMCQLNERQYPGLELIYAIPNGGARHPAVAAKLKAEGVKPGVPDLCLPVKRGEYPGLYIEMKAMGGILSDNQKKWADALKKQGYAVATCWGYNDTWKTICEYMEGTWKKA